SNPDCGHTEDRDVNAAQVNEIWGRGLERTSLDVESPSSTDCSKHEAAIDEETSETTTSTK
ncbi:MAG: transposase, partial [Coleofasciculus sp. F4-SAH-05]